MNTKGRTLLVLSCVLLGILGCRRESSLQKTSVKAVDAGELKIQEALNMVSDWRFIHGDFVRRRKTMSTLREELYRLNDPVRRKNYVKKLVEIVFAYPLDATDPGKSRRIPIGRIGMRLSILALKTCMLTRHCILSGGSPSGSRHGRKKWNGKTIPNPNEN